MSKSKISEFSQTASNNTDVAGVNIAENCPPSGINNAIRALMAILKDQQIGSSNDSLTIGSGGLNVTGTSSLAIVTATTPSSGDNSTNVATTSFVQSLVFPSGGIIIWSGSTASIPSGWVICDGTNSTPDLRNRFVIGAGSTYSVNATGGSADSINVSHTHTASVSDSGHSHDLSSAARSLSGGVNFGGSGGNMGQVTDTASVTSNISVSNSTEGASGTNANLPPYYALAYIMKT